jgi:hypothetical protein
MKTPQAPGWLEKSDQTPKRLSYYEQLEQYFNESNKSVIERLIDFPKYVPNNAVARFIARYEVFKLCLDVHGCVVECGVLGGAGVMTFAQISSILEPYNQTRKVIGFDTFKGFPHVSDKDSASSSENLKVGAYADESYEDIQRCADIHNNFRLLSRGRQVELVRGDICHTVPEYIEKNPHIVVSMLYLDCDLYQPTKTAIEHFAPRMPKGGVIVFDELCFAEFPGETVALVETLGISSLRIKRLPFMKMSYAVLE